MLTGAVGRKTRNGEDKVKGGLIGTEVRGRYEWVKTKLVDLFICLGFAVVRSEYWFVYLGCLLL